MKCSLILITFCAVAFSPVALGEDDVETRRCQLPSDAGPCFASFRRYFYNSKSGRCEMFVYGGCQGNKNNFETLEECKEKCGGGQIDNNGCPPVRPDQAGICVQECSSDRDCGRSGKCCSNGCGRECIRSAPTFKPGSCPRIRPGQFGICIQECNNDQECRGNKKCCGNGCGNQCMDPAKPTRPVACPLIACPPECPRKFRGSNDPCGFCDCSAGPRKNQPEFCLKGPIMEGTKFVCLAYIPSWTYDHRKGECVSYIYGGCKGTENLFDTKKRCEETCAVL